MHLWTNSENLSQTYWQSFLPLFSLSRRVFLVIHHFILDRIVFTSKQWRGIVYIVKFMCTQSSKRREKKYIEITSWNDWTWFVLVIYLWLMLWLSSAYDTVMWMWFFFLLFHMWTWWGVAMQRVWLQRGLRKNKPGSSVDHQRGVCSQPHAPQTLKYLV